MSEPQLTPAQQNLMNFLDNLATSPISNELLAEGYQTLDAAVEENRQDQERLHQASNAITNPRRCDTDGH